MVSGENETRETSAGAAIVRSLRLHGVDTVFGIPGTHNIEIYRGLNEEAVRHVLPRHEQGAVYAADAYAQSSGRPGVVITTSGPGVTNAITGLANSYSESHPILVISPGMPLGTERQEIGLLHEMKDQRATVDSVIERSFRAEDPESAIRFIRETFVRWGSERRRPVHLEVPYDVLAMRGVFADADLAPLPAASGSAALPIDPALVELVRTSSRPLLVVGGGASDSSEQVTGLAAALGAPVVTSATGKGIIDEHHELSVGGFAKSAVAREFYEDSDLIFVLAGEVGKPDLYAGTSARIVRVDVDSSQLHKNLVADFAVRGDVGPFLAQLRSLLSDHRPSEEGAARAERYRSAGLRDAVFSRHTRLWQELHDRLAEVLPADTIISGDSSQVTYMGTNNFWRFAEPRSYVLTDGFATLGYAVPGGFGAKLANPDRTVVTMVGDGAFMFSPQEILMGVEQQLCVPIILIDSGGYAEIETNMRDAGISPLGVQLTNPDFTAFAAAFGVYGVRVTEIDALVDELGRALTRSGPSILHFDIRALGE